MITSGKKETKKAKRSKKDKKFLSFLLLFAFFASQLAKHWELQRTPHMV
jgi:hypothetical protein